MNTLLAGDGSGQRAALVEIAHDSTASALPAATRCHTPAGRQGKPRAAAARFDSLAHLPARGDFERAPSLHAKIQSWQLLHLANALAAAGDTAALLPLADTIETLGARTLGALYRNTHHHVRGLYLAAQGHYPGRGPVPTRGAPSARADVGLYAYESGAGARADRARRAR